MTTAADSQPEGMPSEDAYALVSQEAAEVEAPVIDFRPPMPKDRSIPIGLVGAGGISFAHLDAYKRHGLNVVAIADRHLDRAKARRDQHFPDALATDDIAAVIADPAIRVLDLTPHPESRAPLIRAALESGKPIALSRSLRIAFNESGLIVSPITFFGEARYSSFGGTSSGISGTLATLNILCANTIDNGVFEVRDTPTSTTSALRMPDTSRASS